MVRKVSEGNQGTQAVAIEEDGGIRLPFFDGPSIGVEGFGIFLEIVDIRPDPLGSAVPRQVIPVDGIAQGSEILDQVVISTAVLLQPMDE